MSLECGECERDSRSGHEITCSRYKKPCSAVHFTHQLNCDREQGHKGLHKNYDDDFEWFHCGCPCWVTGVFVWTEGCSFHPVRNPFTLPIFKPLSEAELKVGQKRQDEQSTMQSVTEFEFGAVPKSRRIIAYSIPLDRIEHAKLPKLFIAGIFNNLVTALGVGMDVHTRITFDQWYLTISIAEELKPVHTIRGGNEHG